MVELLKLGINRIAYQSNNFITGKTVNASIWSPTSSAWNSGNLFTEAGEGIYYLDYNFPVTGAYIFKFAENGTSQTTSAYRVWDTDSVVGYISSNLKFTGGGGGDTYYIDGGKKSPWTHHQKNTVLQQLLNALEALASLREGLNKTEQKQDLINESINILVTTNEKIKESQDKNVIDVSNKINGIVDKVRGIESKMDSDLTSQIDKLYNILVKSLCDEDLERMVNELKK